MSNDLESVKIKKEHSDSVMIIEEQSDNVKIKKQHSDSEEETEQSNVKEGRKRIKTEKPGGSSPAKKIKLDPDIKLEKEEEKSKVSKTKLKPEKAKEEDKSNTNKKVTKNQENSEVGVNWRVENVIAQKLDLNSHIVKNVVNLFEADNTIPFIARYRKEQTGSMEPEMLRRVKENYESLMTVKHKINSVVSSITKLQKMTPSVMVALKSCQSLNEVDHIYAQFKPSSSRSLAERARSLGLEPAAMIIFKGSKYITPESLVNEKTESVTKVVQGLQHIIADVISKNHFVLDTLRDLCKNKKYAIMLETKRCLEKSDKGKKESEKKKKQQVNEQTAEKYEIYFSFKTNVGAIKPHQMLAIARAESSKVITVKITIPEFFANTFYKVCHKEVFQGGHHYPFRSEIIKNSMEDAYTRLLTPFMVRHIRSNLLDEAHVASIEVFAKNLKYLLLTPPVRGEVVLGIDPGFKHGCKLAVVNSKGDVLATNVVYIHPRPKTEDNNLIRSLLLDHKCSLIALGNGTACREAEQWISNLINQGYFKPLKIRYTIVDEQGASIYSCSPVAREEFPDMDPNLISAVSLARRVQDPLSELVKVEPKHLGVGMYQHDIPEKKLSCTLNEVVIECVSFVGVDINTASATLLRHVAGLNPTRATNIIDWRSKNGPFLNRDQIHLVKGIGPKTFEQCAGFLRVLAETSSLVCFGDLKDQVLSSKTKKKGTIVSDSTPNPLDQTWIHPESYSTVYWLFELCRVSLAEFGSDHFLKKINDKVLKMGMDKIASEAKISIEKLNLILEGLKQKPDSDIRSKLQMPLFRQSIRGVSDLKVNGAVTGRVQNVTHFGAFIDIGVGQDGLLHNSQMGNTKLNVGDRVEVKILSINTKSGKTKISLGLVQLF